MINCIAGQILLIQLVYKFRKNIRVIRFLKNPRNDKHHIIHYIFLQAIR